MADDVLLNKAATIERCLKRIGEEYQNNPENLKKNFTKQDAILLNLERACEAAIDIAMRLIKKYRLGIPQESREAVQMLVQSGHFEEILGKNLEAMVGFRNIAVHDYQALNLDIVESILQHHLKDLKQVAELAIREAK